MIRADGTPNGSTPQNAAAAAIARHLRALGVRALPNPKRPTGSRVWVALEIPRGNETRGATIARQQRNREFPLLATAYPA